MRVVMTGGGGFIGSYVLARMLGAGLAVTLVGPHTGKSLYTAALVAAGEVRFVRCDVTFQREELLRDAIADADALVLLGYVMPTSTTKSARLFEEYTSNVEPVMRLLRVAGDRPRHVVFSSSVSVYGAPARVPVRESDAPSPLTPYGDAKLACEHAITTLATASGGTAAILRYSTVYGPGELVPRPIPNFIRSALAGEMPAIRGDGLDEHDYVHVTDVAEATLGAIRLTATGVYNIGTGVGTTTLDVARLVYRLASAKVSPTFGFARESQARPIRVICDVEAARAELGFRARRSLEGGICEEIGWFRSGLAAASRSVTKRVA
ncbi:MAG: NAD-dependent epimerase/dehydratase family protein [Candidatus Limnocylindria bacterium]